MANCPAGHATTALDYCDVCGLPVGAPTPTPGTTAPVAKSLACPNCRAANTPDALFCESCGYDFTTGTPPRRPGEDATVPPAPAPAPGPAPTPTQAPAPTHAPAPAAPPSSPAPAQRPEPASRPLAWVAEVWIDPDWYANQGSTEPLPSPGLPDIVPLQKPSLLIGRTSLSRNIHPDIDCEIDSGCSRRHAQLTTDGTRWWIEDLESANGTFVASAAGPLPSMPIGRGRHEVSSDQRIYLGGWTRIVVRRATEDERAAYGNG